MENDKQGVEKKSPETEELAVLDEGQAVADELMPCCKAGAQSARV
jgi:hypothetical protein